MAAPNRQDLSDAVNTVLATRRWMAITLLVGLFLHALNLLGLYFHFLAFQQSVHLGTLVAGFGIDIVFFIITIVYQVARAVLGMMSLVIALTFRGMNHWLPLFWGLLLIHILSRFKNSGGLA